MADPTLTDLATRALMDSGVILACGAVAAVIAKRISVPDIVLFLLTGMLLGPQVLGALDVGARSVMNQCILTFGAACILFDGGTTLRFRVLKERVAQLVMSESALNDVMGAILTFTVFGIVAGGEAFSMGQTSEELLREAGLGLMVGGVLGYGAAQLIAHKEYPLLKDYTSLVTLILVNFAYMFAVSVHASGFMAVFTAGVMLSNNESFGFKAEDIDEEKMHEYVATTAPLFRIFIFILLGSQVDSALIQQYLMPGLAVVAVFMWVARPATVFLCALPDQHAKWTLKRMLFMCWTRETGVIPAALVGLLAGRLAQSPNPPGDLDLRLIGSVTFIAVLATILIQATTTKWLAGKF